MSYRVVPQALGVEVTIDRRAQGGAPGDHRAHQDRRQRPKGSFPPIEPPAGG